ncbi:chromosome partition protein Smc [Striga asiatica]|uniref:Chromosome partition protein Smc n=1 Tax=Striga asiatica TaxID=4170 RepID=A0A5A7REX0_STRAF|nr:chromosome partition protein Smc [Striga asiatica]
MIPPRSSATSSSISLQPILQPNPFSFALASLHSTPSIPHPGSSRRRLLQLVDETDEEIELLSAKLSMLDQNMACSGRSIKELKKDNRTLYEENKRLTMVKFDLSQEFSQTGSRLNDELWEKKKELTQVLARHYKEVKAATLKGVAIEFCRSPSFLLKLCPAPRSSSKVALDEAEKQVQAPNFTGVLDREAIVDQLPDYPDGYEGALSLPASDTWWTQTFEQCLARRKLETKFALPVLHVAPSPPPPSDQPEGTQVVLYQVDNVVPQANQTAPGQTSE